jgi:hypothetical protein
MMRDRSDDDTLVITQSLLAEVLGVHRPTINECDSEVGTGRLYRERYSDFTVKHFHEQPVKALLHGDQGPRGRRTGCSPKPSGAVPTARSGSAGRCRRCCSSRTARPVAGSPGWGAISISSSPSTMPPPRSPGSFRGKERTRAIWLDEVERPDGEASSVSAPGSVPFGRLLQDQGRQWEYDSHV